MFETNHVWLVKSLVRKTNIIRNSDNTQKWATKSKQERYKTHAESLFVFLLSLQFYNPRWLKVNENNILSPQQIHKLYIPKFSRYISKVSKLSLKGKSVERNRSSPLVP